MRTLRRDRSMPTVLRYILLASQRPPITAALPICEQMRRALIKLSEGAMVYSGHDTDGRPLHGQQHAFISVGPDPDGDRIADIYVYCRDGFDAPALEAAIGLETLSQRHQRDIQMVLATRSNTIEIGGYDIMAGKSPQFATARSWISTTPFVPVRHPKTNKRGEPKCDDTGLQIGSAAHDVFRLAELEGFPAIETIEPIKHLALETRNIPWSAFCTKSRSGGRRGAKNGCGFKISFERPIHGPLNLGYGAHRGLGAFAAIPRIYTLKHRGKNGYICLERDRHNTSKP